MLRHSCSNLMKIVVSIVGVCLAMVPLWGAELMTLEGPREAALRSIPESGDLPLTPEGQLKRIDFIAWSRSIVMKARVGDLSVELRSGVVLRGRLKGADAENLILDHIRLGQRSWKWDDIHLITFLDEVPSEPMQRRLRRRIDEVPIEDETDWLFLETDRVGGVLDGLTESAVAFDVKGRVTPFTRSDVRAIRLAGAPLPLTAEWIVFTRDGDRYPATRLVWPEGGDLQLTTAVGPLALPVALLARLETRHPKHRFLGDLKPSQAEEHLPGLEIPGPYPYVYQVNRGAYHRRTLRLDGREVRGIGVHADSRLSWTLPKGIHSLSGSCGLEAMSRGEGSVHFRIRGDGKLLFDSGLLTGTDPARRFHVPLKGVTTLTLECVTDPEQRDAMKKNVTLDRAAWGDLRLVTE